MHADLLRRPRSVRCRRAALGGFVGFLLSPAAVALQGPFVECTRVLQVHDGEEPGDAFGSASARIGDVDGDGIDELLVGARGPRTGSPGRVYLFDGRTGVERLRIDGTGLAERLGSAVSDAGDVDLDGANDLLVAGRGVVRVHSGADGTLRLELIGATPAFGHAVRSLGDVDGDGIPDLAVSSFAFGSIGAPLDTGSVTVFSGASGSVLWARAGRFPGEGFGFALAVLGDVNEDGRSELAILALRAPDLDGNSGAGRVDVYDVRADQLLYEVHGSSESNVQHIAAAGHGDLLLVGQTDPGSPLPFFRRGSVRILAGGTGVERFALEGGLGEFFADATGIGDVDQDGVDEFVVAGSYFDASGFNQYIAVYAGDGTLLRRVRGASPGVFGNSGHDLGDVDGDGFSDLVVVEQGFGTEPARLYLVSGESPARVFGQALRGSGSILPQLSTGGCPQLGTSIRVEIANVRGGARGALLLGAARVDRPFRGGILYPSAVFHRVPHAVGGPSGASGAGSAVLELPVPLDAALAGRDFFAQALYLDPGAVQGVSMTRGLELTPY